MLPKQFKIDCEELYRTKLMDRKGLANKHNLLYKQVSNYLSMRGFEIWDSARYVIRKNKDEIIKEYKSKRLTRRQIAEKYKLLFKVVSAILRNEKIPFWDYESRRNIKPLKIKEKKLRYFSWKPETNYWKMIADYNR